MDYRYLLVAGHKRGYERDHGRDGKPGGSDYGTTFDEHTILK